MRLAPGASWANTAGGKEGRISTQERESESPDPLLRSEVSFTYSWGRKWPKGTLLCRVGANGLARLGNHFQPYMDILSEQQQNQAFALPWSLIPSAKPWSQAPPGTPSGPPALGCCSWNVVTICCALASQEHF